MTIRKKLIGAFLLILLGFCTAVYFLEKMIGGMIVDTIGQEAALFAHHTLDKIDRIIQRRIEEYMILASDSRLQDALMASNVEFEQMEDARAYIDEKDKEWIAFPKAQVSPFMEEILNSPVSGELRERINFYKKAYGYDLIGEIFITNRYGANVAQTGRTSDYRQDDEVWWQTANENGRYISDVKYDESAGVQAIEICLRIAGKEGELLGVMKVVLHIQQVGDILAEMEGERRIDGLVSHGGHMEREFKVVTKDYKYVYATENYKIGSTLDAEFIRRISGGSGRVARFWIGKGDSPQEGRELFAYARSSGFRDYKGLGWILILELDAGHVLAPARRSRDTVAFFMLGVGLFVALIGFVVYRDITIPLSKLVEAAANVGEGQLDVRIESTSKDEIGILAAVFNDMTGKLRKFYEGLEEKIKQRTAQLQASQEHSRLIVDTATDAFISINSQGVIVDWNRQSEIMFGRPKAEAIGKPLAETVVPASYREAYKNGLRSFLETGHSPVLGKTFKLSALHHNGKELPVEITVWSIRKDGDYQLNAFLRDITERQKMEDDLRKSNQGLLEHEQALQKTITQLQKANNDLEQTQLQLLQSEKMASIGQLAAGIAHEINNPVGFISSNIEILQAYMQHYTKILRIVDNLKRQMAEGDVEKAKLTAAELEKFEKEINFEYIMNDVKPLLEHTGHGIERIRKIVMDMKIFSRDEGAETMELVKVEEIIDSILSIVQNEIKYKAELTRDYKNTVLVKCVPRRLGQVFINFLINAAQAIDERGKINIRTYHQDEYVCVDITDTGKGIPPENLKKIFDPFFTTKPVGKGTGLGLSISYEIVKKHGGQIKVRSKVGEGTTFTIMLPTPKKEDV